MCLKRNARSPMIVERGSASTKSRSRRSSSSPSTSRSGATCAIAPCQKIRPITAARWSSAFSAPRQPVDARGDQRLQRVGDALRQIAVAALRRACGSVSSTNSGLPSVLSSRSARAPRDQAPRRRASASTSSSALGLAQRLELDRGGAHPASAPAGPDVEQLGPREAEIRSGDSRTQCARCSISSRSGSSAQWMSSKTSTSGWTSGELVGPSRGGPGDLLAAALALDRLEHAGGEPEQVGDRLVLAARCGASPSPP